MVAIPTPEPRSLIQAILKFSSSLVHVGISQREAASRGQSRRCEMEVPRHLQRLKGHPQPVPHCDTYSSSGEWTYRPFPWCKHHLARQLHQFPNPESKHAQSSDPPSQPLNDAPVVLREGEKVLRISGFTYLMEARHACVGCIPS